MIFFLHTFWPWKNKLCISIRRKNVGNVCELFIRHTSLCTSSISTVLWQRTGSLEVLCVQMCCATSSKARQPCGYTHTHTHTRTPPTHRDPYCDRRLPRPWQAQLSPANSNTVIPLIWERPWLWWICPCKYIPFPLTKHHHMSRLQGPTFCRAQVASLFTAWELFTFWGPPHFFPFSKHELHRYSDHHILNMVHETCVVNRNIT